MSNFDTLADRIREGEEVPIADHLGDLCWCPVADGAGTTGTRRSAPPSRPTSPRKSAAAARRSAMSEQPLPEKAQMTDAEAEVWDEFWETDAARCCSCPSCNYYAPDYEQHKGEPCLLTALFDRIFAARLRGLASDSTARAVLAKAYREAGLANAAEAIHALADHVSLPAGGGA